MKTCRARRPFRAGAVQGLGLLDDVPAQQVLAGRVDDVEQHDEQRDQHQIAVLADQLEAALLAERRSSAVVADLRAVAGAARDG